MWPYIGITARGGPSGALLGSHMGWQVLYKAGLGGTWENWPYVGLGPQLIAHGVPCGMLLGPQMGWQALCKAGFGGNPRNPVLMKKITCSRKTPDLISVWPRFGLKSVGLHWVHPSLYKKKMVKERIIRLCYYSTEWASYLVK